MRQVAWDTLIKQYRDLLNKNETYESELLCLKVHIREKLKIIWNLSFLRDIGKP
jgi:hypothetical protein